MGLTRKQLWKIRVEKLGTYQKHSCLRQGLSCESKLIDTEGARLLLQNVGSDILQTGVMAKNELRVGKSNSKGDG